MLTRWAAPTLISAALLASGCAAVWQSPYKIEFASPTSVTINYDPMLTNMGEVQNAAQTECQKYGKDALPQASMQSPWGLQSISFSCKPH